MEAKEEKIKEAWIDAQYNYPLELVPYFNSDGWAKYGGKQNTEYFKTLEAITIGFLHAIMSFGILFIINNLLI